MIVTGWKNGSPSDSGAGYGVKVKEADRDLHFVREWGSVVIEFDDLRRPVRVNVDKDSFWIGSCRELIRKEIGLWLLDTGQAPWEKGRPPKPTLTPLGDHRFKLSR